MLMAFFRSGAIAMKAGQLPFRALDLGIAYVPSPMARFSHTFRQSVAKLQRGR